MILLLRILWCRLAHRRGWKTFPRLDGEIVHICERCVLEYRA